MHGLSGQEIEQMEKTSGLGLEKPFLIKCPAELLRHKSLATIATVAMHA